MARPDIDVPEFLRGLDVLVRDGRERAEWRALPSRHSLCVDVGPGRTAADILAEVSALPLGGHLYHGVNPRKEGHRGAAKARDIPRRSWMLVDVDPARPKDTSSTQDEKYAAWDVAISAVISLESDGWPSPVFADSGNGYHAYFRVELPNDAESHALVRDCLLALHRRFGSARAAVDTTVCDAPRIAKSPGTWARKGEDCSERPHRLCRIMWVPQDVQAKPVPPRLLRTLAETVICRRRPSHFPSRRLPGGGKPGDQARRYLARVADRVRQARAGDEGGNGRNNALNSAAYYCARFAGAGILPEDEIASELKAAAESVGCPGIEATLRSALAAGRSNPRGLWLPEGGT